MKDLKERKAIGPDRVSGYILKTKQEMTEPIYDIIEWYFFKQKVP